MKYTKKKYLIALGILASIVLCFSVADSRRLHHLHELIITPIIEFVSD